MIGIYKITNLINNKCYIGQSRDISRRFLRHKNYFLEDSHYPLYRAFKKYGIENFSFEIIEECEIDELDNKEIFWIDYYDSHNNGYNQTDGGQGSTNSIVKLSHEDVMIIYDLLLNSNIQQKDIARQFNVGEDTISEINHGKTRVQKGFSFPLRTYKKKKYCIDCGKEIDLTATRCIKCAHILQRKAERPSREELKKLIRTMPFTKIGEKFGVSDNTIRKWCDAENLPRKASDIKSYSDKEWELI